MKHLHRLHIYILLGIIILATIFVSATFIVQNHFAGLPVTLGISFSPDYARQLSLDPKLTYQNILQDLKPKKIRLAAYWDQIEPTEGKFDFRDLDYYVNQAGDHGSQVVLAVGYKLPRWPECRSPKWLGTKNTAGRQQSELVMLRKVVDYYNQNPAVTVFQLENEPLLPFGECPKPDPNFLKSEVELVRSLTKKTILMTDSGELQTWITPMKYSDIFGTTIYREITDPTFGNIYYPFPAWAYQMKSTLVRSLFAPKNQKTIIPELQAEPWTNIDIDKIPIETQVKSFPLKQLQNTVLYAHETGFSEIYLWGVEWWYYLAAHGHPEYLKYVIGLFNN